MAKSLRSKKERTKRREKRKNDREPRERARLRRLAEAALAREAQEKLEAEEEVPTGPPRSRKQLVRYNHVRSMRSGPRHYETQEIIRKEYIPKRRDYEKFYDNIDGDSDDNDVLSDSDTEFQEVSRCLDKRTPEAKERATDLDGVVERKLWKLKYKRGTLPKWLSRLDHKKMKQYKKNGVAEDDLIFDHA
ncbi:uncharacterized protein LOC108682622 [Hyalella azteca]|uniref:Uncharacterized protein LOC108682622 n=1 Tax=Hyalella azteca TaxID=294128 RepID=A0A8B7PMA7_HYAAZ|nr:uncharacterized protein LOC108682622 [Hyalella azteca]